MANIAKLLYKNLVLKGNERVNTINRLRLYFADLGPVVSDIEYTAVRNQFNQIENIFSFRQFRTHNLKERIRVNTSTNQISRTFYNKTDKGIEKAVYKYNIGNKNPYEVTRLAVEITAPKEATIAHNTIIYEGSSKNITSEITEKVKGKIDKQFKRQTAYNQENEILEDNITHSGIELKGNFIFENLKKDKYFHGRFMDMKSFITSFRKTFLKNQNVESDMPVEVRWTPFSKASAIYNEKEKRIIVSDGSKEFIERNISQMINNLNHESRHAWQYEMVEKLDKGLLTDSKDIELAKKFKENFEHYISVGRNGTFEEYKTQPIEADAYNVGDKCNIQYNKVSDYLTSLFKKCSKRILGG